MSLSNGLNLDSHLYSPPMFRSDAIGWSSNLADVVRETPSLTLDPTSVTSIISNYFVPGDRTLWREVRRRPWLSRLASDSTVDLLPVPPHGLRLRPAREIAGELVTRLEREAIGAVRGRSHIYLLLSGGLDSRVVAGVLKRLEIAGLLPSTPTCLTWGLPDSRDVLYARRIADEFGWQWIHVNLSVDDIRNNAVGRSALSGCLVSPVHYHAMSWFDNKLANAVVLAGSYGDSVGRAEFSGRHLLQLNPLGIKNRFGLMTSSALAEAASGFQSDVNALYARVGGRAPYAFHEIQQQAFYMRNLIGFAMSSIDAHAHTYQMFTHPDVFHYMWSLHPACRTDDVYAEALELLDSRLARIPWARSNFALRGRTEQQIAWATKNYHSYTHWIKEIAGKSDDLADIFDPNWFASTGVFKLEGCKALQRALIDGNEHDPTTRHAAEVWLWMVSLRRMSEMYRAQLTPSSRSGRDTEAPLALLCPEQPSGYTRPAGDFVIGMLRRRIPQNMRASLKKIWKVYLRWRALRSYPPVVD